MKNLIVFVLLLCLLTRATSQDKAFSPANKQIKKEDGTTEKRLALVIGNKNYTFSTPLTNPLNDALDMKAVLENMGFDILFKKDLKREEQYEVFESFANKLNNYDVGLVYYSGHGMGYDGDNYLIPVNTEMVYKNELPLKCFSLNRLIGLMDLSAARTKIVFLDACRNNTLIDRDQKSGTTNGLVIPNNKPGTMIVFATQQGRVADDNSSSRNGLFTEELLKHISTPNLGLREMIDKTTSMVKSRSKQQQIPSRFDEFEADFYFLKTNDQESNHYKTKTISDSDGDGLTDENDHCPYVKGTIKNFGCPENAFKIQEEKTEYINNLSFSMRGIAGGNFEMGSSDGNEDEKVNGATHTVKVSDFYMQKYEVTLREFKSFIEQTNYQTDAEKNGYSWVSRDTDTAWVKINGVNWKHDCEGKLRPPTEYDHPVIHVSWNDAMEYAKWFSLKVGREYRLPTEAEWEYAAGNGAQHSNYSWGNELPIGKNGGNVSDETTSPTNKRQNLKFTGFKDGFWYTAPVGSYSPNSFGLHDMTGNVWEWCLDQCDYIDGKIITDTYRNGMVNPVCKTGPDRILRGGGWNCYPPVCRVASRYSGTPNLPFSIGGFRLVSSSL